MLYDTTALMKCVALRKESVDRNLSMLLRIQTFLVSLSARRAWIEIRMALFPAPLTMSLSARRAWIEMCQTLLFSICFDGRSPQGERG